MNYLPEDRIKIKEEDEDVNVINNLISSCKLREEGKTVTVANQTTQELIKKGIRYD
ncbi:MAG: hypothetical protein AAGD17_00930 [Bacteroidota bacterium]